MIKRALYFMSRWALVLLPILVSAADLRAQCDIERYVSPSGSDTNPGSIDRPWLTLGHAVAAVRIINQPPQAGNICVFLRGGVYVLNAKLTLTEADSGRNGYTITYSAYPGEVPTLRGGQTLTGWVLDGDRYKTTLTPQQVSELCDAYDPQNPGRQRCFRQLYVSGERAVRARWPNLGQLVPLPPSEPSARSYSRIVDWVPGATGAISVKTSDLPSPQPSVWTGLEMVVQMYWASNVIRIASVAGSCSAGATCLIPEAHEENALFHPPWLYPPQHPSQPYHFENALWLLDAPGEWYVERPAEAGGSPRVYYKPRLGETIDSQTEIIAPKVETLIELRGSPLCLSFSDFCVQRVVFAGITFEHTGWLGPNQYGYLENVYQSQWWGPAPNGLDRSPAAFHIENARQIRVERNVLRHLGASGMDARLNVWDSDIVGNVLNDVADAGITLGPLRESYGANFVPDGITVANNHVSYTGQDYRGGPGIVLAAAERCVIEHNDVSFTPYVGVNVNWGLTWSPGWPDNVIRGNHIQNAMKLLVDGGAIYVQGKGEPEGETIIEDNYVHDILRSRMSLPLGGICNPGDTYYPTTAIYLDQGSKFIDVHRNVILDASVCAGPCGSDCAGPGPDTGRVFLHCCDDYNSTHPPIDNGGEHGAVKVAAGLEPAYESIAPAPTPGSFVTRLSIGTIRNDHDGRVGFKMTVGSRDLIVRQIGRFRAPGNVGIHTLRIAQVSSPFQECSASVNTRKAAVDALGFQYASFQTPCRLLATQQYRITTDETYGGDYWYDYDSRMRSESDGVITGSTYRVGQTDYDVNDPDRGLGPVNIVYDGQKLISAVSSEGAIRTVAGQQGMKIAVGSHDLYVWRLGRYFLEGDSQSHAVALHEYGGSTIATANVSMGSAGGTVDEKGFKYATLAGGTRLSRATPYFLSSAEQGVDSWLDYDTTVSVAPDNNVNPAYLSGTWQDVTQFPGQSYGPVSAVYEPLNRALPCQTCFTVGDLRNDGYRQGMRITVRAGKTLTVTEIGRLYFAGNQYNHVLAIYDTSGALKASATINMGAAPLADDGFKYVALALPLLLTQGDYYVSDESATSDTFGDYNTVVVPGPDVSDVRPVYFDGATSTWTTVQIINQSYGPMNMIYYVKP